MGISPESTQAAFKEFVNLSMNCACLQPGEMVLLHQQWQASMAASGRRGNGEIDTERMNALIADLMRERWGEWFHRVHREYLQPVIYLSWDLVFVLPPNGLLLLVLLCSASARA